VGKRQLDNLARYMAMLGVAFPLLLIVFYYQLGTTSFLGFAFIGLTALQLSLRPTVPEMALTVLAGSFYGAAYAFFGGSLPRDWPFRVAGVLAFLGTGSLLAMAARVLWNDGERQRKRWKALLAGLTPIVFLVYMPVVFSLVHFLPPDSFDRYLYAFDSRFGFQAAFAAGRLFADWSILKTVCSLIYMGLPLAMAAVYVAVPVAEDEPSLMRTFLLVGVVGVILFQVVPAAGPVYAFTDDYPNRTPAIAPGFIKRIHLEHATLNAIPSLHTAWALLIAWRTRSSRLAIRGAAAAFLFLTLLATLGLGEHYLIDLVVAVPYTVCMRAACMNKVGWSRKRIAAIAGNAALVALWLSLLRQGVLAGVPAWCAWSIALMTVSSALWLNASLFTRLRTEHRTTLTAALRMSQAA
jgi:hypothetical protein